MTYMCDVGVDQKNILKGKKEEGVSSQSRFINKSRNHPKGKALEKEEDQT